MGRRSIRANKNIYQLAREEAGLTREKASERMAGISDDRIEKIESEKVLIRPDEVLQMSRCYKKPELCNLYCSRECAIGIEQVPEIKEKDLTTIALEILSVIRFLDKERDLLIDIAADGRISEEEIPSFEVIKTHLESLAGTVDALNLWLQKQADH
ncbi:MAG TPA: transcriptional regulator [Lachnospiraceae bacterium]|nr:transcriptional regulator [Lachnospiraceae bacterium]